MVVFSTVLSDSVAIPKSWPLACASARAAATTPAVNIMTAKIWPPEYLLPLNKYPMIMEATGPPDRRMIWSGTEILYANAQLFSILTVMKNKVYAAHDRRGIARALRKRALGPAERERK